MRTKTALMGAVSILVLYLYHPQGKIGRRLKERLD